MKNTLGITKKISTIILACTFFTSLTACASASDQERPSSMYNVTFDADGKPTVTTKDGKAKGQRAQLPVKASQIEDIKTYTVMRVRGSHFLLISIGGELYKFDLPH